MNFIEYNLEHARHVEIERLTFTSIYAAITAGTFLAFPDRILAIMQAPDLSFLQALIPLGSVILLFLYGLIGLALCHRWSDVFDEQKATSEKLLLKLIDTENKEAPLTDEEIRKSFAASELSKEKEKNLLAYRYFMFVLDSEKYVLEKERKIMGVDAKICNDAAARMHYKKHHGLHKLPLPLVKMRARHLIEWYYLISLMTLGLCIILIFIHACGLNSPIDNFIDHLFSVFM